jgi:hypothetical protein
MEYPRQSNQPILAPTNKNYEPIWKSGPPCPGEKRKSFSRRLNSTSFVSPKSSRNGFRRRRTYCETYGPRVFVGSRITEMKVITAIYSWISTTTRISVMTRILMTIWITTTTWNLMRNMNRIWKMDGMDITRIGSKDTIRTRDTKRTGDRNRNRKRSQIGKRNWIGRLNRTGDLNQMEQTMNQMEQTMNRMGKRVYRV